ncbi:MAG: hypothetical protein C0433_05900 [Cyclobacterium sp.]|nr:hypothetical protein [Cyclobacterium sp.]
MSSVFDNILPKISKLSKRFDKKESYTGKSWVLIDDSHRALMELEYFKDGRLLLILNGNATWGKWEVSPNTNRLILDFGHKISVYEVSFVDQALMLARKSGTRTIEVFVNKKELPSLLYQFYLDSLVQKLEKNLYSHSFERKVENKQEFYRQRPTNPEPKGTPTAPFTLLGLWDSLPQPIRKFLFPDDLNGQPKSNLKEKSDIRLILFILLACVIAAWIIGNL